MGNYNNRLFHLLFHNGVRNEASIKLSEEITSKQFYTLMETFTASTETCFGVFLDARGLNAESYRGYFSGKCIAVQNG